MEPAADSDRIHRLLGPDGYGARCVREIGDDFGVFARRNGAIELAAHAGLGVKVVASHTGIW